MFSPFGQIVLNKSQNNLEAVISKHEAETEYIINILQRHRHVDTRARNKNVQELRNYLTLLRLGGNLTTFEFVHSVMLSSSDQTNETLPFCAESYTHFTIDYCGIQEELTLFSENFETHKQSQTFLQIYSFLQICGEILNIQDTTISCVLSQKISYDTVSKERRTTSQS